MKSIVALAISIVVSGCATTEPRLGPNQYEFAFVSHPSGAVVYKMDGTAVATTPYKGVFNVSPETTQRDQHDLKFTVVWASGARTVSTQRWTPKTSKHWTFTFSRPVSAPNLDIDLRQAAAQESLRQQQREADAEDNRAAVRAFLGGFAAGQRGNDRSLNCSIMGMGKDMAHAICD